MKRKKNASNDNYSDFSSRVVLILMAVHEKDGHLKRVCVLLQQNPLPSKIDMSVVQTLQPVLWERKITNKL